MPISAVYVYVCPCGYWPLNDRDRARCPRCKTQHAPSPETIAEGRSERLHVGLRKALLRRVVRG